MKHKKSWKKQFCFVFKFLPAVHVTVTQRHLCASRPAMGIPKFYRWLSERYPLINQVVNEGVTKPEFGTFFYSGFSGSDHGVFAWCIFPQCCKHAARCIMRPIVYPYASICV
jgi:hypothetical protein